MFRLRQHLRAHRWHAFALIAAALLVRVCVPAGFMPVAGQDGTLHLAFCSGYGPMPAMDVTIPGMHHQGDDAQMQSPCAFADLALVAIGGTDPIQLAALLLFVLATGLAIVLPLPPRAPSRLRPPLRGPPHSA